MLGHALDPSERAFERRRHMIPRLVSASNWRNTRRLAAYEAGPSQRDGSDHRGRRRLRAPPPYDRYQSTGPFNKPTMSRMLEASRAEACLPATNQ